MFKITTNNAEETIEIGERLGKALKKGAIILLSGDLGAGKTVFTKGIARGLDIDKNVTSPTFTLIHQYDGRLPLYHFDIYRILNEEELYDIGYEEYFFGDGVTVVEWPERMEDLRPDEYISINIEKLPDNGRCIIISTVGKGYDYLKGAIA